MVESFRKFLESVAPWEFPSDLPCWSCELFTRSTPGGLDESELGSL